MYDLIKKIEADDIWINNTDINTCVISSMISTGSGHSRLNEIYYDRHVFFIKQFVDRILQYRITDILRYNVWIDSKSCRREKETCLFQRRSISSRYSFYSSIANES